MTKLRRQPGTNLSDTASLRLRAAWLYYNRGWTQAKIADYVGVSRSTVIRMLEEARARTEVQVWIDPIPGEESGLSLALEEKYGLAECVVVPSHGTPDEIANDVGAALGRFLSERISSNMTIGVTWGRTLSASLQTFRQQFCENTRVVSLVGGVIESRNSSPIDFSWRLASRIGADCYLYLAPLFVPTPETKVELIENSGLRDLHALAKNLDLAVINCGDLDPNGGSMAAQLLDEEVLNELREAGAVGEVGCSFIDVEGNYVEASISNVTMSVHIDRIATAKHVLLASGGAHRSAAIHATILRTKCHSLVTDEGAAKALLEIPSP